ncbi:MAG TPA: hypothetical protein VHH73_09180 [Verrucomicrobiae bacterium]|nr:hypothetical protein [Verrucomicrobiae bacterium]
MTYTLQQRYCEQTGCPPGQFEEKIFNECLPPSAMPLARLVRRFRPHFFQSDFLAIRYCGEATSFQAIRSEIDSFAQENRDRGGFLRRNLKLRISGRRLMDVARQLLPTRPIVDH